MNGAKLSKNIMKWKLLQRGHLLQFLNLHTKTLSRDLAALAFKSSGLLPLDPSTIQWEKVLPIFEEPRPASGAPAQSDTNLHH